MQFFFYRGYFLEYVNHVLLHICWGPYLFFGRRISGFVAKLATAISLNRPLILKEFVKIGVHWTVTMLGLALKTKAKWHYIIHKIFLTAHLDGILSERRLR